MIYTGQWDFHLTNRLPVVLRGITADAAKYLVDVLLPVNEVQREGILDQIIEAVQKQALKCNMIDRNVCQAAVQECNHDCDDESENFFSVIDAFDVPKFAYSFERKKFLPKNSSAVNVSSLFGDASSKAELFRERYTILQQRTSRHDLFAPAAIGARGGQGKKFQLKPVEFLLGSSAKLGEIIVLGMLTQLKEGKWYLEDPTGAVQLDLSRANFHTGLFTENCFVLAEGWYEDEVFHINAFGFPPPEASNTTRAFFGHINFFGGPSIQSVKASAKLRQIEADNEDAMFVMLSDVWLDQVKVVEKLRTLLTGYSEAPPVCFILCGNFTSEPYGPKHIRTLKESLNDLSDLICEFPDMIQSTRFIFVPGPRDPGVSNILPRPSIPEAITADFRRKVPSAVFTSNPCRLQYCTQEVVVFREDIVMKMCRNCVQFPSDGDIPTHFAKTMISQGHLCPLPLHVEPVYWTQDQALRVYPLPDLIICADKYDPYSVTQQECIVANPGSFPRSDFSFKVYYPASRQVENSRIEDD